jgi:predicted TIM-barrel enzyme
VRLGFSGVQNFPTVGLIDGRFRLGLEETGMGYACEVEMIAKAHARDLLTTPYVFDPSDAAAMARAGADLLVCHFGLTTGGSIGAATSVRLEECPALTDAMAQAALAINPDMFVLVHGGPIAEPDDAAYVFARARHCDGFYGASSMERLPVERALPDQVARFKSIKKAPDQGAQQARAGSAGGREE